MLSFLLSMGIVFIIMVGGLILRTLYKQPFTSDYSLIPCDFEEMESVDLDMIENIQEELELEGFEVEGDFKLQHNREEIRKNSVSTIYMRYFRNKVFGTTAQVTYSTIEVSAVDHTGVVVSRFNEQYSFGMDTMFEDTLNVASISKLEPALLNIENEIRFICTDLSKVGTLIGKHMDKVREMVQIHSLDRVRMGDDLAEVIRRDFEQANIYQEKKKVLRYDSKKDVYFFTFTAGIKALYKMIIFYIFENRKYVKQQNQLASYVQVTIAKPKLPRGMRILSWGSGIILLATLGVYLFAPITIEIAKMIWIIGVIIFVITQMICRMYRVKLGKEYMKKM